jgi:chromosome segregation ATPase
MAEKKVIELEVKTESLKPLKAQLREAQAEVTALAEKFGATSQEAIQAAKRAAELKDAIADAKDLTDAFNPDAKFNALSNSIGGVLNGFQAYEGALGLIGVESEALQETLLKVQSAMALSQGLQGVGESIDSFKQLGGVVKNAFGAMTTASKAFIATGVGLVIAAVAYAINEMSAAAESAAAEMENLEKATESLNDELEFSTKQLTDYSRKAIADAKLRGATEKELLDIELDAAQKSIDARWKNASERIKANAKIRDNENASAEQIKKANAEIFKAEQEKLELKREASVLSSEFALKEKELADDEIAKNKERAKAATEAANEALEKRKEKWEKEKELSEKQSEDLIEILKNRVKQEDEIIARSSITKVELQEKENARINKLREDEFKDAQGFLQAELIANQNNFQAKLDLLELQRQKELQNKELTEGEIAAIEARYAEQRKQISDAEATKKIENQQKTLNAVKQSLQGIADLAMLFAGQSEKEQKKAFEIQKAANIAQATIDTFSSAQSAYKSVVGVPVVGPALAVAAAAAAITAGLLNIKKIASTTFESPATPSSPNGGGTDTASTSSVISPNFNIVGNAQATNPLAGLGNQPIQAYVVSGEVTTAQNLDRNRINYATFG